MNRFLQLLKWFLSPLERGGAAGVCSFNNGSSKPILKVALLLVVNFALTSATAQNFPVQVIPQALPPAPIYISNYADASTVTSPLRVQIILNDFEIANREVRLKTYFTGSGLSFQSNDIVVGASPLFLEGGIPLILTNVELAPYFEFTNITGINANQYGNAIPEGAYQFCVEVYDVLTGSRLSNKSCAVSVVFQNEPPFLVLPRNKENVDEVNPQYIVFQWTPRSINVSNVEYELSLVEIWDTQVDPQQAFLSSPPIFQTTTTSPTYVYGPTDPLLLSGKNYAWRVQAKAKQGTEEIGLFKNQGYSEIYSFSYASACELPLVINHEVKGSTNANIVWDDFATEIPEFTVRYRQKGNNNEWFESKTTTNLMTLWDLKAGTIYEYQVQKKCSVTESTWSLSKQFTTFIADDEDSVYECGINPDFSLSNREPLASIGEGEEFVAGDFPIKVLEANGSNGRFTGKGYVTIPYLSSIRVGVEFTNVLINTDKQLVEGSVITMYDPSLSNILDIDEAIDTIDDITDTVGELFEGENDLDEMRVNFAIPKDKVSDIIKVVDGNVVITNPENGESISEPLGDDKVVVDGTGQVYHIDAGGNITEGGQIDPGGAVNSGNVEGVSNNGKIEQLTAEGITVTFNTPSTYGFDQMPSNANEKLKKQYTITQDAKGNPYVLAHHAVKKGAETQVTATITLENNTYSSNDVIFKTKQGEVIPKSGTGNTLTLTIKGSYTFENETIYAVVPSKEDASKQLTAGAFTLWHLTDRAIDLVLVSVNNASLGAIETTVKDIFKQGVATINFGNPLSLSVDPNSLGSNGLDVGESAWAAAYNDEQKQLISAVQNLNGYNKDSYYILVFGNDIKPSRSIAGFMPLQRQMGFVFTGSADEEDKGGDKGKVLAHELGHGVFALQHPFSQFSVPQRSTDWLMDYNGGTSLPHIHWAQIHDPALKFYVFQDEEEGQSTRLSNIPTTFKNSDDESFTFLTLDGGFITLPTSITDVEFTTGLDNLDGYVDYPSGALIGFTLNGKKYQASTIRSHKLEEVVVTANSNGENNSNNDSSSDSKVTTQDFTTTFDGFVDDSGNLYPVIENNKKYYGEIIVFIPGSSSKYLVQFKVEGLIYKEPGIFNFIDDYSKYAFLDSDKSISESYSYEITSPFREQHNLAYELTYPILNGSDWSVNHAMLVKFAELNNANPSIFKAFFEENHNNIEYANVLKDLSISRLKEEYIELINYFIDNRKSLLEQFNYYCDNTEFVSKSAGSGAYVQVDVSDEILASIVEKLSSEQISSSIDFNYRKKALNKLFIGEYTKNSGNLINGKDIDRFENQILRLLKFTPDAQIDDLLSYIEISTESFNEKHIWYNLFNEINDSRPLSQSRNNRSALIKILTELFFRSERFTNENEQLLTSIENLNSEFIAQRTVISNYQDIFQRTWVEIKKSPTLVPGFIDASDFYIKYDTRYNAQSGGIDIEKNLTLGYLPTPIDNYPLKPFDLILFKSNANLRLLSDYNTGEGDLIPVPAIVLHYDDSVRDNDTTSDIAQTTFDIVTLVIPGAQFAQLGKIGRIIYVSDKLSSITSIAGNATESVSQEASDILSAASVVLGIVDITNSAGKSLKNLVRPNHLNKTLEASLTDYNQLLKVIDEVDENVILTMTEIQKKQVKAIAKVEFDALKSEGIANLNQAQFARVINKLDGVSNSTGNWINYSKVSQLNVPVLSKLDEWVENLGYAKANELVEKLESALGKYPELANELSDNLKLIDHFEGMHNSWYYRLGLARAYKVTTQGSIDLPDSFGNALKDLDMYNGQTIRSAFDGNNSGAFGIALEQKMGGVLEEAFNGGVNGIKGSDIPADLKTYYEGIYNQGYTKMLQQVRIKTPPPETSNPVPDFFFFKTKVDIDSGETLDMTDVIYHDSKISINSSWSNAQLNIRDVINNSAKNGVKAEFELANSFDFNGETFTAGTKLTIKEMSKIGTDVLDDDVLLIRKIEVSNPN